MAGSAAGSDDQTAEAHKFGRFEQECEKIAAKSSPWANFSPCWGVFQHTAGAAAAPMIIDGAIHERRQQRGQRSGGREHFQIAMIVFASLLIPGISGGRVESAVAPSFQSDLWFHVDPSSQTPPSSTLPVSNVGGRCVESTAPCGADHGTCCSGAFCRRGKCFEMPQLPRSLSLSSGGGNGGLSKETDSASANAHQQRQQRQQQWQRQRRRRGGGASVTRGKRIEGVAAPIKDAIGASANVAALSPPRWDRRLRFRRQESSCATMGCDADAWALDCSCDPLCLTVYFDCCPDHSDVCVASATVGATTAARAATTAGESNLTPTAAALAATTAGADQTTTVASPTSSSSPDPLTDYYVDPLVALTSPLAFVFPAFFLLSHTKTLKSDHRPHRAILWEWEQWGCCATIALYCSGFQRQFVICCLRSRRDLPY
jgi:hypothetical protein